MAKIVTPVNVNTMVFQQWVDKTNEVIDHFDQIVTLNTGDGDITPGNGFVIGVFGANTLTTSTLRGGNISTSGLLSVTSNLNITSNTFTINVGVTSITSANIEMKSNNTITAIRVSGNSTSTNTVIGGNTFTVTANSILRGPVFVIPSGNTGERPAGNIENGTLRFNSEFQVMEIRSANTWKFIVASSGTSSNASVISFTPTVDVTATNVEDAIYEVSDKKVAKAGGTMSGQLIVDFNSVGTTAIPNSLIFMNQSDGLSSVFGSETVAQTSSFTARRSNGTTASKTQLVNGNDIFSIDVIGRTANGFSGSRRLVRATSTGDWTTNFNPVGVVLSGIGSKIGAGGSNNTIDSLFVYGTDVVANASLTVNGVTTLTGNVSVAGQTLTVSGTTVSANISANNISANTLSGNGAGITLVNAVTLGSQLPSYFTDIPARLGFTPLPASEYTALNTRTQILTVDGTGSGIDSDLLDGQHGTYFLALDNATGRLPNTALGNGAYSAVSLTVSDTITVSGNKIFMQGGKSFTAETGAMGIMSAANTWLHYVDNSGNFVSTGNITAYSDERLKDNVETISDALNLVKSMRGVKYDRDGIKNVGVIAQEMMKVLPEVVLEGEYLSVMYGNLVGVLIEAIKELSDRVEILESNK